jgi:hypothetical protein
MADQTFTAGQILTASQMSALQLNSALTPITPSSVTNGTLSGNVVTITSGSSSVTVSGAFSTNFPNYKIIVNGMITSTAPVIYLKLNASTGSTYNSLLTYFDFSNAISVNSPLAASANGFQFCFSNTSVSTAECELFGPFATSTTSMRGSGVRNDNPTVTLGYDSNSASQTGFTLVSDTGNFTAGTIRVYGYR